jgi:Tfp pilus assembly protein PilF
VDFFFAPKEVTPKAKTADEKALKLDDHLAEAHSSLGMISYQYDYDWAKAERELKRAIALNPNYAEAHHQYGWVLILQGRFDEGSAEMKRGVELDPLSLMNTLDASLPLSLQGKRDAAVEQARKALDIDPNFTFARWVIAQTNAENGHLSEAIAEFQQIKSLLPRPYLLGWLGYAYAASGDRDNALKMIAELNQLASKGYVSPFYVAIVHLGLGDKDLALAGLAKAYEVRSQWLVWLKVDRIFEPLRSDPRFQDLLKKVGLDR